VSQWLQLSEDFQIIIFFEMSCETNGSNGTRALALDVDRLTHVSSLLTHRIDQPL
jgi:hypothetical protein